MPSPKLPNAYDYSFDYFYNIIKKRQEERMKRDKLKKMLNIDTHIKPTENIKVGFI
jgi:hypothetical protein